MTSTDGGLKTSLILQMNSPDRLLEMRTKGRGSTNLNVICVYGPMSNWAIVAIESAIPFEPLRS